MTKLPSGKSPDHGRNKISDTHPAGSFEPVMSAPQTVPESKPSPDTRIGIIRERYELRKELGDGAFGIVYKCWDKSLHRTVALKVLKPKAMERSGASEDFMSEARAMAAISNDHVMPILDFGIESGQAFIVMPLLGGETLDARIEREGFLSNSETIRVGREIAAGLAAIHAKGLIHRDLKPNNIWLEAGTGRVKILDFGLAHNPLNPVNTLSGTPSYMSPEQVDRRSLDARSDLFSLGSVLYFCASGRGPFRGDTMRAVLDAVALHDPPSLLRLNPGVSPELGELIERLMRKSPDRRPASAREVFESLAALETKEKPVISPPLPMPVDPIPAKRLRSRRGQLVVAILAFVASSLALAAYLSSGEREKLRVKSLEVLHFAGIDEDNTQPKGVIGKDSFEVHLEDEIEVRAELNRPGYCYLIIFRPDGQAAVLYPQDENDVPELTDKPVYPSKNPEHRYFLEEVEKPGLWMVAAFVSDKPLPSFAEWRKTLASNPWKPVSDPVQFLVAKHDGLVLDALGPAKGDGRGSKVSRDKSKTMIEAMVHWFESQGASATAAVGFPVEPVKNKQP